MEDQTNTMHNKFSRELRTLYNLGVKDYELEYLISLKRKQDISKKWKR